MSFSPKAIKKAQREAETAVVLKHNFEGLTRELLSSDPDHIEGDRDAQLRREHNIRVRLKAVCDRAKEKGVSLSDSSKSEESFGNILSLNRG